MSIVRTKISLIRVTHRQRRLLLHKVDELFYAHGGTMTRTARRLRSALFHAHSPPSANKRWWRRVARSSSSIAYYLLTILLLNQLSALALSKLHEDLRRDQFRLHDTSTWRLDAVAKSLSISAMKALSGGAEHVLSAWQYIHYALSGFERVVWLATVRKLLSFGELIDDLYRMEYDSNSSSSG